MLVRIEDTIKAKNNADMTWEDFKGVHRVLHHQFEEEDDIVLHFKNPKAPFRRFKHHRIVFAEAETEVNW